MVRRVAFAAALLIAGAGLSAAQNAQNVQTDPLQCWWRTSTGAVRVGEPFSVVLTCAVLETDAATVVVDQSRLEPSVVQFAPFEVLGGSHGADLRSGERRFFQYEYRLRLIAENMFGKDAALPETKVSYRVQSRVADKTAIQGRDLVYLLPTQSVRVLSLVPADASDIRDAAGETFGDIDQRSFRANLFVVVGSVLFVIAALLTLLALVRLFRRYRTPAAVGNRPITDGTILRGVGRELAAVRRERQQAGGWTAPLAGRALAALRVAATYALGRRVGCATLSSDPDGPVRNVLFEDPGRLLVRTGWPKSKQIAVSGAVTTQMVSSDLARVSASPNARRIVLLQSLEQALRALTTAQYSRDGVLDDAVLDEALDTAGRVLRRMRLEQTWIMKRFTTQRRTQSAETRAWSR